MHKSNMWDGFCGVCRTPVRAGEGLLLFDRDARRRYTIVCVEHAPAGSMRPPAPPEASKLPSIHVDDRFG